MTSAQTMNTQALRLMGQAELPPSVLFGETDMELWPYRRRTVALLRRYARASVEVGRLPSLLGREFFRSRVTSYTMRNFEDVVIFVADMEKAITTSQRPTTALRPGTYVPTPDIPLPIKTSHKN